MKQVDKISIEELKSMSEHMYDCLVKAVVDIEKRIVVLDADLHVDEEQFLLSSGSKQADLWGINLYPESFGEEDFIEFDSMINIRPAQNNRSRAVEDPEIQETIHEIIAECIYE